MDINSAFYRDEIRSFVDEEYANFSIGKGKKNVKVSVANVLLPFTLIGKAKRTRAKEAAAKAEKAKQLADEKALKLQNARTDAEIAKAESEIKIAEANALKATKQAITAEAEAKIAEAKIEEVKAVATTQNEVVSNVSSENIPSTSVYNQSDFPKRNKTLMYVGGGIATLVVAYLLFKKK